MSLKEDCQSLLINSETHGFEARENSEQCNTEAKTERTWGCNIPCRYVLTFMLFLAQTSSFAQRGSFSIALVAMVNFTMENDQSSNISHNCPDPINTSAHAVKSEGHFNWDPKLQGLLIGAFYYGYPLTQLPGGYIIDRFGGKYVFAFMGLSTGILSLLIPVVAEWSPYGLIAIRALQGLFQGPLFPLTIAMLTRWVPPKERNNQMAIAFTGINVGTVVALGLSGYMCDSSFLGGWPSVFYVFGSSSILCTFLWLALVYSTPEEHPWITTKERMHIEKENMNLHKVKCSNPPWFSIITSGPVWAIFAMKMMDSFSFYILYSDIQIYMKQVLRYDVSQDGLMTSLPYIVQLPFSVFAGWLADFLQKKDIFRLVNIRRSAVIIGEVLPSASLILLGYIGCAKTVAVAILVLSKVPGAFASAGVDPSIYDVAPLYAGTLMGLLNGLSNIPGFVAPMMVAALTENSPDERRWRAVFYIGAAAASLGTIIYCIFISDKEQDWAKGKREVGESHEDQN